MILPRLIIADEHRPGKVPAGVMMAAVLKEMGYRLKLFLGNIDEPSMRILQVMCGQPVTLLDPLLCGGKANLRWLFQSAASPDCINLVIMSLGGRWSEDSAFRIPKECLLMAEYLECEVIPIFYSDTSSTITIRTVTDVIKQFENSVGDVIHSVLFRSILNYREYELVDREVGRQTSAISLGSISRSMERESPPIADLCSGSAAQAILPVRSAAVQIKSSEHMIQWGLFSALAQNCPEWKPQPRLGEPISDAGKVNVAVVRSPALTLGGDGTEHLMRMLGCNVVEVPLEGGLYQNVPIHGVYVPHGLTFLVIQMFFDNAYLRTMLTRGSSGSSFFLVEGGSAPILGDRIVMPPGFDNSETRGFSVMPYDSVYRAMNMGTPRRVFASGRKANPLLRGSQEFVGGYISNNLAIASPDPEDECWNLRESPQANVFGSDAWCKGRALVTRMRIEPWSAPESFRRWLEG
ncbi:MAG: hypothetical protein LBI74_10375 [Synergistaceae bacterium]|nr:hypothetical protein [Synergistaceae bacterium]